MQAQDKHPRPVEVVENAAQMFRNLREHETIKPVHQNQPKRAAQDRSQKVQRSGLKGQRKR